MGYVAPVLTVEEVAEAIAPTDTFWTLEGKEFEIDSADYSDRDGTLRLEGYICDEDGDKHFLQILVEVKETAVDSTPYDVEYDDWEDGVWETDEEDDDAEV